MRKPIAEEFALKKIEPRHLMSKVSKFKVKQANLTRNLQRDIRILEEYIENRRETND